MDLQIFYELDLAQGVYNNVRFISGTELEIFAKYSDILQTHKEEGIRTCVLAHCNDMVIVTNFFRKHHPHLRTDFVENPNFEMILISPFDYQVDGTLPVDLPNFTWIYFPEYNGVYWEMYCDLKPLSKNDEHDQVFLCMNKRVDIFRQVLCYVFYENDWVNKNIFTYLGESKEHTELFDYASYYEMENAIVEKGLYDVPKSNLPLIFARNDDYLLKQYEDTKMVDKVVNGRKVLVDPSWEINREWYAKTYCSLVLETNPDNTIVNLSEKTFRAIMMQHPLYVFGAPNTYDYFLSLGFKLLSENKLWDKGNVYDRFKIFLRYVDILHVRFSKNFKEERKRSMDHSIILRNQYYILYQQMLIKQSIIKKEIFEKFKFLKTVA